MPDLAALLLGCTYLTESAGKLRVGRPPGTGRADLDVDPTVRGVLLDAHDSVHAAQAFYPDR